MPIGARSRPSLTAVFSISTWSLPIVLTVAGAWFMTAAHALSTSSESPTSTIALKLSSGSVASNAGVPGKRSWPVAVDVAVSVLAVVTSGVDETGARLWLGMKTSEEWSVMRGDYTQRPRAAQRRIG